MLLSVAFVLVYRYIDRIPILLGTFWSCLLKCQLVWARADGQSGGPMCELLLVTFQGWPRCFGPRDSGMDHSTFSQAPPFQPAVLSTWNKTGQLDLGREERLFIILFDKTVSCCFVGMFCASLKGGGGCSAQTTRVQFFVFVLSLFFSFLFNNGEDEAILVLRTEMKSIFGAQW